VDMVMVWFGALVAVTLQTAFLSPPVAMSAYYLRQVVKEWSLATIYKGMFEFMILQCLAIALIVIFPQIATSFPMQLQAESRAVQTEDEREHGPALLHSMASCRGVDPANSRSRSGSAQLNATQVWRLIQTPPGPA